MPKIFHVLDKIKPVYDIVEKIMRIICKLLLIADILVTCYIVIGRYISFIDPPVWGEQVVLTLMVYLAVLSATIAIRNTAHIRMTCFDRDLPKTLIRILDIVSVLLLMVLGYVMLVYGWDSAYKMFVRKARYDSLPWLSRFWMYFPVAVAGASMIIFEIEQLYQNIRAFFIKEEKEVVQ